MAVVQDPAVQRRRLRTELRKARTNAKYTQRDVAEAMSWSVSKVTRIEGGDVGVSKNDLLALLTFYGIRDKRQIDDLVDLAQGSRKQPWSAYRDIMDPEVMVYLGHEGAASVIRQYQPLLIPGLLQIEEYAKSVMVDVYGNEPNEIDLAWQARQERQEVFDREDPPTTSFIIDESAVRRLVGGVQVMRRQLEQLKMMGSLPHIEIQVVPLSAGAHPGMRGPATILSFRDAADDDVIFLEGTRGDGQGSLTTRDRPEGSAPYLTTFFDLQDIASRPEDIVEVMDRFIAELEPTSRFTFTKAAATTAPSDS